MLGGIELKPANVYWTNGDKSGWKGEKIVLAEMEQQRKGSVVLNTSTKWSFIGRQAATPRVSDYRANGSGKMDGGEIVRLKFWLGLKLSLTIFGFLSFPGVETTSKWLSFSDDSTRMSKLESLYPVSGNGETKYVEWNHEVTADVLCEFLLTNRSEDVSGLGRFSWGSLLTNNR
jgi:hypothetical protein